MSEFKKYQRKGLSEMRPFLSEEILDMREVSISTEDLSNGSPKIGDMIARNPLNHKDKWLVAEKYFNENLELAREDSALKPSKTLHNSNASGASVNVKDIIFWGNGDTFKLISKASSKNEGWMKSTKAMQIDGIGCVIQVTTQQGDNVSEALTFVPNVVIEETFSNESIKTVISRKIVLV